MIKLTCHSIQPWPVETARNSQKHRLKKNEQKHIEAPQGVKRLQTALSSGPWLIGDLLHNDNRLLKISA
ncbi:MAG: hypothetical protein NC342_02490 [Pseudoflavonifractor sp.]|nr:hypothetical protein [Pseudoflavonifractor sp.]